MNNISILLIIFYLILDIDECGKNPCGPNAVCRNTPGSYECVCPHHFRGDPYYECSIEGKFMKF